MISSAKAERPKKTMTPTKFPKAPPRPTHQSPGRVRWLLHVARWLYAIYLRANGWRHEYYPSATKPARLVERWVKVFDSVRYTLPTHEALALESKIYHETRHHISA